MYPSSEVFSNPKNAIFNKVINDAFEILTILCVESFGFIGKLNSFLSSGNFFFFK